ncbi:conserved hypothetical protein [Methanococcus vannielii SB]|uniref:Outer membrane lipoprotein-sorting protein-like protein n=1 Tax=Methanococcus vannielii (strain ATCC 35089 / DSM 1224 / JCM 13029 / OCM 148 / SB) TaxID=406327 RepID=A6UQB9_METVS|nr:hypothetical protein [Methanococcus vannielii]ABR54691.1 conserved hypothetical protein [Methanococcus vannielii SB]
MICKKFFMIKIVFLLSVVAFLCGCINIDDFELDYDSIQDLGNSMDFQESFNTYSNENSEIRELIKSQNEIWSYAFDYNVESIYDNELSEIKISGKVDTRNKKAYITMFSEAGSLETYYFEDSVYLGAKSGGETNWMKIPSEESSFEEDYDMMSKYDEGLYGLKNGEFELVGEETVNGIRCYKLKMNVKNYLNTNVAATNIAGNEDVVKYDVADVAYYVDKSNGYILKTAVRIKGTDESSIPFDYTYFLSFKDINKVQNIELPIDAKNAIDVQSYYLNYQ